MSLKIFGVIAAFFSPFVFFGQTDPVRWEARYDDSKEEILITASIDKNWHIYSQNIAPEVGPISTNFTFSPGNNYELISKPTEDGAKNQYDKMFDAKIGFFEEKAIFRQKLKRKNLSEFTSPIKIEYTTCNDKQCFPAKTIEVLLPVGSKK